MNELMTFNNPDFGEIRTVEEDGAILFCGSDVARALGYNEPHKAVARHCKGGTPRPILTNGGQQEMVFIPESDLYRLIFKSKLPAAEAFTTWVTTEVLPSIRKHGGYIVGQSQMSDAELLSNALLVAQRVIEERDKRIAELHAQAAVDAPKVAFADAVTTSAKSIKVGDFAKALSTPERPIGRNRLFRWMRANNILDQNNVPYQKYLNAGYFEVVEVLKYGQPCVVSLITGKGQAYLYKKYASSQPAPC